MDDKFSNLMNRVMKTKDTIDQTRIVRNQPLRGIRESIELESAEAETDFNNDINTEDIKGGEDNYESYEPLCDQCMIRTIVGCNGCGIYQYTIIRNEYEITVRRTCCDGTDAE